MATYRFGDERRDSSTDNRSESIESAQPRASIPSGQIVGDEPEFDSTATTEQHTDVRGDSFIDPSAVTSSGDGGRNEGAPLGYLPNGQPRKRRAKGTGGGYQATRGSREKEGGRKTSTQATLDLNNMLFSLHMMGAALTKNTALVLTEDESKKLAAAITRVTELYEIPLLDEKSRAWINLSMVGVEVYGTRLAAAFVEGKKKRSMKQQGVIQMPNVGTA